MKKLWVNVVPYEKGLAIAALESGAEAVVLPDGKSETVRQFGNLLFQSSNSLIALFQLSFKFSNTPFIKLFAS